MTDPLHDQPVDRDAHPPHDHASAQPARRTTSGPPRRSDHADAVDTDDVHEFSARGDGDDRVHAVDVRSPESALIDPSPYTTRCGQAVLELYNDHRQVTCSVCA